MALKLGKKQEETPQNFNEEPQQTQDEWMTEDSKGFNSDIYERAKQELMEDFIQDMADSASYGTMNEEQLKVAQKRYSGIKTRKVLIIAVICFCCLALVIFGIKRTFFTTELTYDQIAAIANYYNGRTNFPVEGIQGYLTNHVPDLLLQNMATGSNVTEMSVDTPVLVRVNCKSDSIANVYFYTTLHSNKGDTEIDCMMPLSFNFDDIQFHPAGEIIITPSSNSYTNVEVEPNQFLSFDGINKASEADNESAKAFVTNFFTFMYSGRDVSPYYDGGEVRCDNLEFISLDDFQMYQEANKNGYNTVCTVTLKTNSNIDIVTLKYLTIEKNGTTWLIKYIL